MRSTRGGSAADVWRRRGLDPWIASRRTSATGSCAEIAAAVTEPVRRLGVTVKAAGNAVYRASAASKTPETNIHKNIHAP